MRADRSLGRVAVRSATLGAVVLFGSVPVYVYVEPSWRAVVARVACAFVLGVALGLMRPEAWPLLLVYAGWLWFREPRLRVLLVLGLFSLPFFWFVPPWIGSGHPFLAASHAADYNGQLGSDPFITVLGRGLDIQTIPVLVFGVVLTIGVFAFGAVFLRAV